ncbi:MAG: class I SAM-dependent methyltransferase [Rhizomicrobium sp.]
MSNPALREQADPADDELLRYAGMQKSYYQNAGLKNPESWVVGHYDYHENVPYETNLLFLYGDIRHPVFEDFGSRRAFDIACGEGRMVRRMQNVFGKVDGADISSVMIDLAEDRTPGSDFWVTDGLSAGAAPSGAYDFVYCTISLQHICVFETRDMILKDICRILKPDGKITLQYAFSKNYPALPTGPVQQVSPGVATQVFKIDRHHAQWFDNKTEAQSTNGGCDVVIGPDDLPAVQAYFNRYFESVDFWFYDVSVGRGGFGQPRILPPVHPNSHISDECHVTHFVFIHCSGKKV